MIHRLFTTCSCVDASRANVCVLKCSKSDRRNGARRTFRTSGANGGRGTAACGCKTGALIPTLPPSSSSACGANSLPSASSSKLPVHRSPGGNRLIVRAFTTPLAVPTSTVFDPSIGPKYLPCSNRESRGPRRRLGLQRHPPYSFTELCQGRNSAPSHMSLVCCLTVPTHRKSTVHAGCTRHKPRQHVVLCWHFDTRS